MLLLETCQLVNSLVERFITKDFSTNGTNDFSVSSDYVAQFARGIWNWLT
jgi:hypothetical protein